MRFRDRHDAGRRVAEMLRPLREVRPVVLALPRGGVPVAAEVARALDAPLDVLLVRKLGAPGNPELGIGAIAEGGVAVLDRTALRHLGVSEAEIERLAARQRAELDRLDGRLRAGRPPLDLRGRTVVVVDDGMATGLTDLAAVHAARGRGAARVVVAVPVASREAAALLRDEADEVVCVSVPERFLSVGRSYVDFEQVSDDEVVALLGETGLRPSGAGGTEPPAPGAG